MFRKNFEKSMQKKIFDTLKNETMEKSKNIEIPDSLTTQNEA